MSNFTAFKTPGYKPGAPSSVVKVSSVNLEVGSWEVTELRWECLITYRWHWFLDERGKRQSGNWNHAIAFRFLSSIIYVDVEKFNHFLRVLYTIWCVHTVFTAMIQSLHQT
jgi:hypothetical protein